MNLLRSVFRRLSRSAPLSASAASQASIPSLENTPKHDQSVRHFEGDHIAPVTSESSQAQRGTIQTGAEHQRQQRALQEQAARDNSVYRKYTARVTDPREDVRALARDAGAELVSLERKDAPAAIVDDSYWERRELQLRKELETGWQPLNQFARILAEIQKWNDPDRSEAVRLLRVVRDSTDSVVRDDAQQRLQQMLELTEPLNLPRDPRKVRVQTVFDQLVARFNEALQNGDAQEVDVLASQLPALVHHRPNSIFGTGAEMPPLFTALLLPWVPKMEIVKILINHGANVQDFNERLGYPIHIATSTGEEEIVDLLIAHGAEVNVVNPDGSTPLCLAAMKGNETLVQKLLSHGADRTLTNLDKYTALDLAVKNGHDNVAGLLRDRT